jgi:hypothetical protein
VTDALLLPDGLRLFAADIAFGDFGFLDAQTERSTITYATFQTQCLAWVPSAPE